MVKGLADHAGLRLTVETSVFVLLAGAWLWGIVALGAHATATQGSASDGGGPYERAVVSCPAPRDHAGTSRQPGRSSDNAPSTHPGE